MTELQDHSAHMMQVQNVHPIPPMTSMPASIAAPQHSLRLWIMWGKDSQQHSEISNQPHQPMLASLHPPAIIMRLVETAQHAKPERRCLGRGGNPIHESAIRGCCCCWLHCNSNSDDNYDASNPNRTRRVTISYKQQREARKHHPGIRLARTGMRSRREDDKWRFLKRARYSALRLQTPTNNTLCTKSNHSMRHK